MERGRHIILRGSPLEIGSEVGCLREKIIKAMESGRVEDLGRPLGYSIDGNPEGNRTGLLGLSYDCQVENCILVAQSDDVRVVGSLCGFGVWSDHAIDGRSFEDKYTMPRRYTELIVSTLCPNIPKERHEDS